MNGLRLPPRAQLRHINLYREAAPARIPFSSRFILLYTIFLVLGLGLLSGLLALNEHHIQNRLERARADLARLEKQLERLKTSMPKEEKARLKKAIAETEARIEERQRLLANLQRPLAKEQPDPADLLGALAAAHRFGIWLTHIHWETGTSRVILEGGALRPSLIPAYMEALSRQPLLSSWRFRIFQVEEHKEGEKAPTPYFHFHLASGLPEAVELPERP